MIASSMLCKFGEQEIRARRMRRRARRRSKNAGIAREGLGPLKFQSWPAACTATTGAAGELASLPTSLSKSLFCQAASTAHAPCSIHHIAPLSGFRQENSPGKRMAVPGRTMPHAPVKGSAGDGSNANAGSILFVNFTNGFGDFLVFGLLFPQSGLPVHGEMGFLTKGLIAVPSRDGQLSAV